MKKRPWLSPAAQPVATYGLCDGDCGELANSLGEAKGLVLHSPKVPSREKMFSVSVCLSACRNERSLRKLEKPPQTLEAPEAADDTPSVLSYDESGLSACLIFTAPKPCLLAMVNCAHYPRCEWIECD